MSSLRHAEDQARVIWPPTPGLFSVRLTRGGWAVPARIVHDEAAGLWHAEIDGEAHQPHSDPVLAPKIDLVWTGGRMIDQGAFDWLFAVKEWAQQHDPDHPCLSPRRAINPNLLRPMMPREVA